MKLSVLPAATLVLGGAIGFMISRNEVASRTVDEVAAQNTHARPHSGKRPLSASEVVLADFLKGRSPDELTPEEAFQLMRPVLTRHPRDHADQSTRERLMENYQFRLLLNNLPTPVLKVTLDLARDGSIPFPASHEVFAAYAERGWDTAIAWAASQPDKRELISAAISLLAETDPERATLLIGQMNTQEGTPASTEIVSKLMRHHARRGQKEFFAFVKSLPGLPEYFDFSPYLKDLPPGEIPAFLDNYRSNGLEAKARNFSSGGKLMLQVENTHPAEFQKWLDSLDFEEKSRMTFELASKKRSEGKVEESRALIRSALASLPRSEVMYVRSYIEDTRFPQFTADIISMLPDDLKIGRDDLHGDVIMDHPVSMFDDLQFLGTTKEKVNHLISSFGAIYEGDPLGPRDFEMFSHRLEISGLTGTDNDMVREALESARIRVRQPPPERIPIDLDDYPQE
ncbi:MAG: hypothetical protein EOP88_04790 [Verrucomicrobiaceae bacterium]|nr:MAG: hypothetical protein EOP88_04790 [Verrucomicrobiaceae bacterium]